jgi:acyl carrier protein
MKERIIKILCEIRPEFDFREPADFMEAGMLDSFDVFNLVNSLDNEFGISIDGMDIIAENFSTIDRIVVLLNKNGVAE